MIEIIAQAMDPDQALRWSEVIGQIFDQWWDRILLILSVLANLGFISRRAVRKDMGKIAESMNPFKKHQ